MNMQLNKADITRAVEQSMLQQMSVQGQAADLDAIQSRAIERVSADYGIEQQDVSTALSESGFEPSRFADASPEMILAMLHRGVEQQVQEKLGVSGRVLNERLEQGTKDIAQNGQTLTERFDGILNSQAPVSAKLKGALNVLGDGIRSIVEAKPEGQTEPTTLDTIGSLIAGLQASFELPQSEEEAVRHPVQDADRSED